MTRKLGQNRLGNLELLIQEAGSLKELARLSGTNSSYLSQIRNQTRTPAGTPRRMTGNLAETLERAMRKPEGWMDEFHELQSSATGINTERSAYGEAQLRSLRPLISWVQAGEWTETSAGYVPEYEAELLPCPIRCSHRTFVLKVCGISMEPLFSEGDLIYVDPEVEPVNGKYVVVRLDGSNETTFKQLVIEQGRKFLRALNPDWPEGIIEINRAATICGVVVFKGAVV